MCSGLRRGGGERDCCMRSGTVAGAWSVRGAAPRRSPGQRRDILDPEQCLVIVGMYVRLGCVKMERPKQAGRQAGREDEPCIPKRVGAWTAAHCSFLLLPNVDIPNHDVLLWHCVLSDSCAGWKPSGGDIKSNNACNAVTPNDTQAGQGARTGAGMYAEISRSGIQGPTWATLVVQRSRLTTAMASTTLVWQARGLSGRGSPPSVSLVSRARTRRRKKATA